MIPLVILISACIISLECNNFLKQTCPEFAMFVKINLLPTKSALR